MEKLQPKIIHELPRQIADKIAAGEVVDRPLSIVKELLENSIDAGATSIVVEIKNGGKSYIRVTDNGCGIAKDQTLLAFKRHATSKISTAEDLDSIETLGFRGEALASIAAVSKTELITKTAGDKTGIKIIMQGGEVAEQIETGCPDGTTILVMDLFYNTPARLKFLKADHTESTLVIDLVSKIALAYPSIKIRLINNGNILFSTPGKGDTYTNILTIYSKEIGQKLIRITETDPAGIVLDAYVSAPQQSKTNRKSQIFFVNGRYVESKLLTQAVALAYAEKLFEGRYPIAFLFLTVLPNRLDVNIHPNKKQVRFDDEAAIKSFVVQSIQKGLLTGDAVPEVKASSFEKKVSIFVKKEKEKEKSKTTAGEQVDIRRLLQTKREEINRIKSENAAGLAPKQAQSDWRGKADTGQRPGLDQLKISGLQKKNKREEAPFTPQTRKDAAEPQAAQSVEETPSQYQTEKNTTEENIPGTASVAEPGLAPIRIEKVENPPFDIQSIRVTGSIFNTYITGVDEKNFYLIDQHAAHERIFYEKLLREFYSEEKPSQALLLPYVVEVSFAVKNDAFDWLDCLTKMGYLIEEFGVKSYVVKEIPFYMSLEESKDFLNYFLDNLTEGMNLLDPQKLNRIITRACKSAVKAHDVLSLEEIQQLMKDLSRTENPFTCPHGRPTFIRFSHYEIEKMFKRV